MTALMLPGQAAAPEGPIDLTMMYLLHHGFRRDLARFLDAARRTPVGETATWPALVKRWDLFALLLHDHHHKEDEHIWPLLRAAARSAGDATGLAVLDEMEAEHDTIDPLLDAVRTRLTSLSPEPSGSADPPGSRAPAGSLAHGARDELVELLDHARRRLDHHLGHEETDAIALLQRYISAPEWEQLDRSALRGGLGPAQLAWLVPWAVHGLHPEITAGPLRAAGWPFRLLLRLGRPRFERLELAAFRHVRAGVGA